MKEKTRHQPNFRMFRSLRTLQGLDYIHCLRGIRHISFWDHTVWVKSGRKQRIRDRTFEIDVRNTVRKPKYLFDHQRSQSRSLVPLLAHHNPPDDLWHVMFEVLPELRDDDYGDEDSNGDHSSETNSEPEPEPEPDSDSDSDSNSDSDGGGDQQALIAVSVVDESQTISANADTENNASQGSSNDVIMTDCPTNVVDLTADDETDGLEEGLNDLKFEDPASQAAAPAQIPVHRNTESVQASMSPKREETSPPASTSSDRPLPGEESLFVSEDSSVVDLTGENDCRQMLSRSPEEAQRAIDAHVRGSIACESAASDSTGLFASETPYNQLVPSIPGSNMGNRSHGSRSMPWRSIGSRSPLARSESDLFVRSASQSDVASNSTVTADGPSNTAGRPDQGRSGTAPETDERTRHSRGEVSKRPRDDISEGSEDSWAKRSRSSQSPSGDTCDSPIIL